MHELDEYGLQLFVAEVARRVGSRRRRVEPCPIDRDASFIVCFCGRPLRWSLYRACPACGYEAPEHRAQRARRRQDASERVARVERQLRKATTSGDLADVILAARRKVSACIETPPDATLCGSNPPPEGTGQ